MSAISELEEIKRLMKLKKEEELKSITDSSEKKTVAEKKNDFLKSRAAAFMGTAKPKMTPEEEVKKAKETREKEKFAKKLNVALEKPTNTPLTKIVTTQSTEEDRNSVVYESTSSESTIEKKRSSIAGGIKLQLPSSPDVSSKFTNNDEIYSQLVNLANGKNVWEVSANSFKCIMDCTCFPNNDGSSGSVIRIGKIKKDRPKGKTYIIEENANEMSNIWEETEHIVQPGETGFKDGEENSIICYKTTRQPSESKGFDERPDGRIIIIES